MQTLNQFTGDSLVDHTLARVVGALVAAFLEQIRAVYLTGSWSNGTGVYHPGDAYNSSDLDLHIVFRGQSAPAKNLTDETLRSCRRLSPLAIEAHILGEEDLCGYWDTSLKQESLLLYGEDIREAIILPALVDHIQRVLTFPPYILAEPRHQREPYLEYPLSYPDPAGEFYGYDYVEPRYTIRPSTRPLVGIVTWAATAILAVEAGVMVGSKREAVRLYAEHIQDEWGGLIEETFQWCKLKWQFLLPVEPQDRHRLREICRRMLGLENHLLRVIGNHLRAELRQNDEDRRAFAAEMLGKIIYSEPEVTELVRDRQQGEQNQ